MKSYIMFVDSQVGMSDSDIKKLEAAGYIVILVLGEPVKAMYETCIDTED